MAGHSKWANIQHRKGRQDEKRQRVWTRVVREIMVAARTGGGDPSVFIHDWFKTFFVPSEVNGQMLTKRNLAEKVLIGWRKQSMGPNCLVPENLATPCSLDKNKAPFRLLAVVNRQDVRGDGGDPDSYGGPLGEGRFVFNILKYDAQNQLKKSKANVIFEYNLPSIWKDPFSDAWEWANRWHKLASAPMQADDEVYKQQLQTKITDVFATANNLAQVRSEEIDFDPNEGLNRVWSFREYELRCPTPQPCNAAQKRLMPRTVTLTPNSDHNKGPNANTSLFATWFKSPGVIDSVLDGTPEVPLKIGDTYFRGAESLAGEATNSAFRTLWGAKLLQDNTLDVITVDGIVPYKARHQFGVTTCNGCHYDETDTSMMFIRERDAAVESQLADFLKTSTAEGEIRGPQTAELAKSSHAKVHHDQAGHAAGRVHHHEQEDQAEVEQPGLGPLRQQHDADHHQHRADDGAEEEGRAAEEDEQQVGARALRADDFGGDDLEVKRREATGDAGEEAGDHEGAPAHLAGVVADELDALGVVAHGVEHAAQRRAREGEHQRRGGEGVQRDQVVQLDLRPEADAQEGLALHAVAADAAFAAEEAGEHQRHGGHQFAHAQRDHGKGCAGLLGGDVAQQHRKHRAEHARHQRHQAHRHDDGALAGQVQRMDGKERAQAGIHGVAEAEHAALPQQHVEGQAGDDGNAHLRQQGQRQAGELGAQGLLDDPARPATKSRALTQAL